MARTIQLNDATATPLWDGGEVYVHHYPPLTRVCEDLCRG